MSVLNTTMVCVENGATITPRRTPASGSAPGRWWDGPGDGRRIAGRWRRRFVAKEIVFAPCREGCVVAVEESKTRNMTVE
jgi:hypothetical protein